MKPRKVAFTGFLGVAIALLLVAWVGSFQPEEPEQPTFICDEGFIAQDPYYQPLSYTVELEDGPPIHQLEFDTCVKSGFTLSIKDKDQLYGLAAEHLYLVPELSTLREWLQKQIDGYGPYAGNIKIIAVEVN